MNVMKDEQRDLGNNICHICGNFLPCKEHSETKTASRETEKKFPAQFGISDRHDGNMCFSQDEGRDVTENRERFFKKVGLDPRRTVMPDIVHGNEVAIVSESDLGSGVAGREQGLTVDGLISYTPDTTLAVDTGDCPVILFSDTEETMIGLAHAGWKSLDGGIIKNMIDKIKTKTPLEKISVALGVGICQDCYRFPEQNPHPLLSKPNWEPYRKKYPDGTVGINLNSYIRDQLEQAGLKPEQVKLQEQACSYHSKDAEEQPKFFSHRRASQQSAEAAKQEGRFITFIHLAEKIV